MAGAAIFTGRLVAGRLMLACGNLGMVRMLLHGLSAVQLTLMRGGRMAVAAHRLHGGRNGQRVAAEERQPDGQDHCDKFSESTEHGHSLAKSGTPVK